MATGQEVADYACSLVGQKVTVATNPYGGQCVALIDHIVQHFSDKNLAYTNAKDCLIKAASQGLEVIYNDPTNPNLIPQTGDFFVMQFGASDPFGHIGVCISADQKGMRTVEQNIDGYRDDNGNGINDQLEEGGGGYTRNHYRNYENVIGWFRLPYTEQKRGKEEGGLQMKLLTYDDAMDGYPKGAVVLLNLNRGTYHHIKDPAELGFIRKAYKENNGRDIPEEHVSRKYPAHVRYIEGFRLVKIE